VLRVLLVHFLSSTDSYCKDKKSGKKQNSCKRFIGADHVLVGWPVHTRQAALPTAH